MSEFKFISPLLDNFDVGGAISDHNGVCCYPAMRKNSDDKYIIKTVSIPASQTQLDALLLTGAYPDEAAALLYFKELADNTVAEFKLLQRLSQLDGFVSGEECQVVAMDDRVGCCVYIRTPYRRTLSKHLEHKPSTQLSAINLGLDLCAALAVCRQAGYLYVDLKPSNIFVTTDNGYRIGDLGFIALNSLKYASLPAKYHSAYTAPEVTDAFAPLNTTLDIYAAGMILYQIYNGGELPVVGDDGTHFNAPQYADYEMAEIILKACDPDPEKRWQDPVEMGQALVSYMQRNGANDVPIVIPTVSEVAPEAVIEVTEEEPVETAENAEVFEPTEEVTLFAEADSEVDEESVTQPVEEDTDAEESTTAATSDFVYNEDDFGNLSFLEDFSTDETSPENTLEEISYEEVSDDISEMLSQIDELTAHQVPDPVVAPAPIEITIPDPITPAAEEESSDESDTSVNADIAAEVESMMPTLEPAEDEAELPEEEHTEEPDPAEVAKASARRKAVANVLRGVIILLLVAIIGVAGYLYYRYVYLLNIDSVTVEGNEVNMVVNVSSQVDESLLSVVCSDSHGNHLTAPVVGGKATFANLAPDTAYNIKILVDGFHRLTGDVSASYSTPALTNVVQFNAVTGSESGSVILGFTVEGPDSGQWSVVYSADGEEEKTVQLLSHMITLTGLTVGKEYTFTLVPTDDMYVAGMTEIQFTASDLIYAENLIVSGLSDDKLTTSWNAPKGVDVPSWTVRCYDNAEYNETIITTDTHVTFEGVNAANSFTIEVTAAGMSVSQRTYVTENTVTISDFVADTSNSTRLTLSWNSSHDVPEGGWILLYSIDGSEVQGSVVTDTNSAVIFPMVPDAEYTFTLQDSNGTSILSGNLSCKTPKAVDFSGYGITPSNITYRLCHRPEKQNWTRKDLSNSDFTTEFEVGDEVSILVKLDRRYAVYPDDITSLYVIRDESGKVVTYSHYTRTWDDMWYQFYCEMNVPKVPTTPGNYTMSIYYNGLYTGTVEFTIK